MNSTARPRGRPKGTGIDDSQTLNEVMSLLASEAGLRPTTAIRRAGISDPSVVRRLREKLKIGSATTPEPALARQVTRRPRPLTRARVKPARKPVTPPREIPIKQSPQPEDTRTAASHESTTATSEASASETPRWAQRSEPPLLATADKASGPTPPPLDPQLEALRLSAEASAAMSRLFLHCMTFSAQTNPWGLALRSQTIMSEFFASMLSGKTPTRPE